MRTATARFTSHAGSDLFFGLWVKDKKLTSETHEQYEERTWKKKIHCDEKERVFLQPFALKNGLVSAAKWLSMPIPGEGKKTFTKRFQSGVLVVDRMLLMGADGQQLKKDDVDMKMMFVPSGGDRGGGKRVQKCFPFVAEWSTKATLFLMDDKIDKQVLLAHLEALGNFIGFGSMRVENGGINGRFTVDELEISTT